MDARSPFALPAAAPFPAELEAALEAALAAQGPDQVPPTRSARSDGRPKYVNRLLLETSPYLLQHAHNPVDWRPWGAAAFEAAERLDRPIFLSVGYSSCHWCHVMEVESFEDEEVAAFLNARFIPVKVDREERPDVDTVYMSAVQLMNQGRGGWPMTVVLTPKGKPFFGGTYFPPRDGERGARLGLLGILGRLDELYARDRARVTASADELHALLAASAARLRPQGLPGPEVLGATARALVAEFDPRFGGFGAAPKFPRPSAHELLLRFHRRSGDPAALEVVTRSLARMLDGGIHDQLAGGFHRYSTDDAWLVPHFEKMLCDNAQLGALLLDAYQASGDRRFAAAARRTLDYVLREMTSPEGGFYSATDADSEGVEGRFFVWSEAELVAALGEPRARVAALWFGVSAEGHLDGKSVLHRPVDAADAARALGLSEDSLTEAVEAARLELYAARARRVAPRLDDKVLTEWNGQMISAFAQASLVLGEPRYAATATRAAEFVLERLRAPDGRLLRAYRAGRAGHDALLEDYAALIAALLAVHEATQSPRWLEQAVSLEEELERRFLDPRTGAFFQTPSDAEPLLFRELPAYDGAQPSGNAVAALNLLRLAALTGRASERAKAERVLRALGSVLERAGPASAKLAAALDWYHDEPKELVLITTPDDDGAALRAALAETYAPNRVFVSVQEGEALERLAARVPLVANKRAVGGRATAYLCTQGACEAPTTSPDELRAALSKATPLPLGRRLSLPR